LDATAAFFFVLLLLPSFNASSPNNDLSLSSETLENDDAAHDTRQTSPEIIQRQIRRLVLDMRTQENKHPEIVVAMDTQPATRIAMERPSSFHQKHNNKKLAQQQQHQDNGTSDRSQGNPTKP
jgi:uncharacterized Zn-finger protein